MSSTNTTLADDVALLLQESVGVVFDAMVACSAVPAPVHAYVRGSREEIIGSVGFAGQVNGVVYVHLPVEFARQLAGRMLGLPAVELADEMVNDVVGELSNMIVGSVKSRLCDAGSPCALTIPSILRGRNLRIDSLTSDQERAFVFSCNEDHILLELLLQQTW